MTWPLYILLFVFLLVCVIGAPGFLIWMSHRGEPEFAWNREERDDPPSSS